MQLPKLPKHKLSPPDFFRKLDATQQQRAQRFLSRLNGFPKERRLRVTHDLLDEHKALHVITQYFIDKELTYDELKLYYLFLEEYTSPQREESIFSNKNKLLKRLRARIKEINKSRETWLTLDGKQESRLVRDKDTGEIALVQVQREKPRPNPYTGRFLSTNQLNLYSLFNALLEKQAIFLLPREVEWKAYPKLILQKGNKKVKRTQSFQPSDNIYFKERPPAPWDKINPEPVELLFERPTLQEKVQIIGTLLHTKSHQETPTSLKRKMFNH